MADEWKATVVHRK